MTRRRRWRIVAALTIAAAAACTTFGTGQPSPDSPAADGGREADRDGSNGQDGSGPNPPGDGQAPFCETNAAQHAFCADFSTPPVYAGWNLDDFSQTGGGTIGLFFDDSTSKPSSFVADVPPYAPELDDSGAGAARARLCKKVVAASRLRLAFSMKVLALDLTTTIGLASLRLNYKEPASNAATLYIDVTSTAEGWRLQQSNNKIGPDDAVPIVPTPPVAQWMRVELQTTLTPGDGGVYASSTVIIDGKVVAARTKDWPSPDGIDDEVCIGIVYVPRSTSPIRLFYDDVTIDVTPR